MLLFASGCSGYGLEKPSVHALGVGARESGLFDDKRATDCVGRLIRNAGHSREMLHHVARGDLDGSDPNWSMGEDQGAIFDWSVERQMPKKCGVHPWFSASSFGDAAVRGGLTNDPKAANCVGALIRDSGLSDGFLGSLVHSSFRPKDEPWWVTSAADKKAFQSAVESKMFSRCGAHPWPATRPWNGQADESVTTATVMPVRVVTWSSSVSTSSGSPQEVGVR